MGKEILDLDLAESSDNSYEVQNNAGGNGSSKRRGDTFRGTFDLGAVNEFPDPALNSAFGSGLAGKILRGDRWIPSTDGFVPARGGGNNPLETKRAFIEALSDEPGQDPDEWATITF